MEVLHLPQRRNERTNERMNGVLTQRRAVRGRRGRDEPLLPAHLAGKRAGNDAIPGPRVRGGDPARVLPRQQCRHATPFAPQGL